MTANTKTHAMPDMKPQTTLDLSNADMTFQTTLASGQWFQFPKNPRPEIFTPWQKLTA